MSKFLVIGQVSGKVYAKGEHKIDCFRELNKKFPTLDYEEKQIKGRSIKVYPEPLLIVKKDV